jgi:hypothetical protein
MNNKKAKKKKRKKRTQTFSTKTHSPSQNNLEKGLVKKKEGNFYRYSSKLLRIKLPNCEKLNLKLLNIIF